MAKTLVSNLPVQTGYFYSRKAAKEIKRLIETYKPDHLYCQFIRTTEYLKDSTIKKTVDYQDVLSHGIKRRMEKASVLSKPVYALEYKRLLRYEKTVFDIFDNKTIISIPDRNLIPHPDKHKIHVVPNGVDHSFFKPMDKEKEYDIAFTGNMGYPPNVDAAEFLANSIMPLVWLKLPQAKLLLAGASPAKKVCTLENDKIKVTGWMDDIRDAYSSSRVFIAPMRIGTGLQNKLLEAMSMRIPSITTTLANDALAAEHGKEILVGNTAQQLADYIINLLNNKEDYNRIAQHGYDFVHANHSWEMATEKLHNIINES